MMMSFYKVHENARAPMRAHPSDAGCDVFFCPGADDQKELVGKDYLLDDETGEVTILPGGNCVLPSGLCFGIPHGYGLFVCNRGSMGALRSLVYGGHVIDSGFDGEVGIDLHNIGNEPQTLKPGDKIAQLVLSPVVHFVPIGVVEKDSLYNAHPITISDRGGKQLGSSNGK